MKRDKNNLDVDYEKNCDQCTFHPNTQKEGSDIGPKQIYAKNIEKFITRIKHSRKESNAKNLMHKRGYHEIVNFNQEK